MTTFLDTNVVIALLKPEDAHHAWSVAEVQRRKDDGPLVICDIVYCEVSVTLETRGDVDAALAELGLDRLPESDDALFAAGKAYKQYKANKGPKDGVLPDLLIGATAFCEEAPLLTADPRRYKTYFPELQIELPPKGVKANVEGRLPAIGAAADLKVGPGRP